MASSKLDKEVLYKLFDGTKVCLVNGDFIRDDNFGEAGVDFVYGGHGYVYKFIPKDEIWVERSAEQQMWAVHEIFEYTNMKYLDKDYEEAHEKANNVEYIVRMLAATVRLRQVLAQAAAPALERADPRELETVRMTKQKVTPEIQKTQRQVFPSLKGRLLHKYTDDMGQHFAQYLTKNRGREAAQSMVDYMRRAFPQGESVEKKPLQFIQYSLGNAFRDHQFFLTWDAKRQEVCLYEIPVSHLQMQLASLDKLARIIEAKKKKKKSKSKRPAKVKEIADAIQRDHPEMSEEQVFRMSWESYCSYINPSHGGCTSKGKSHRKSPKSDYSK